MGFYGIVNKVKNEVTRNIHKRNLHIKCKIEEELIYSDYVKDINTNRMHNSVNC